MEEAALNVNGKRQCQTKNNVDFFLVQDALWTPSTCTLFIYDVYFVHVQNGHRAFADGFMEFFTAA